jgi:predicted metal-dependent phosphoesterase TrpH
MTPGNESVPPVAGRFDLHVHSSASDGALAPVDVVAAAGWGGLEIMSLTDHDTVAGVEDAVNAGIESGVRVLPGIEVSSTWGERELHFLGYFIDPSNASLQAHGVRAAGLREARLVEMVRRLRIAGLDVPFADVVEAAGVHASVLARPHLAAAMVKLGVVESVNEAFAKWIGDQHPAFVPTRLGSPLEAIQTILDAGGIPMWAHPPGDVVEELLSEFVQGGLRGIEVFRPRHQARDLRFFGAIAASADLLVSGGSDWHNEDRNGALGTFSVGRDEIGRLLEAGGW